MGMEGAEDGAFGGEGRFRVVDGVDEEGETEDVGEEDEFLSHRISQPIHAPFPNTSTHE
jgi:hypothetical protein